MNSVQILAFLMTGALVGLMFWYAKKRQYKRSAIFAAFWLVPLVAGYSLGKNVSVEQWVFWSGAVAALYYAHRLLKDNHIGYSFVAFLIAAGLLFSGSTAVQTLLKTHLLWQVTSSLKSYGEKIDTFQTTVADMKVDLDKQQATNTSHAKEFDLLQSSLRKAVTTVGNQSQALMTQSQTLMVLGNQLAVAQTNLVAQQKKVENVEYWIENLNARTTNETFSVSDPSRVLIVSIDAARYNVFLRLSHAAIPGTMKCQATDPRSGIPQDLAPEIGSSTLNLVSFGLAGFHTNGTLNIHYVIDTRQTNLFPLPQRKNVQIIYASDKITSYKYVW